MCEDESCQCCGTVPVEKMYLIVGRSVCGLKVQVCVREVPILWYSLCVDSRYLNADKNTNKCVLIAEVTLNDRQV
jgi:hypothetical protein